MRVLPVVLLLLPACTLPPPPPVPAAGKGLIAFDPAPPPRATTYERPAWNVGDRMVFLQGGRGRVELQVVAAGDEGYVLQDPLGRQLRRSRDLGDLGEGAAGEAAPARDFAPEDFRYHWPLWVGKRWRCHYVDRTTGKPALPIEAAYEVEGMDTIVTPGGTFEALRIVRTARLQLEGTNYPDRVWFTWYAPAIGLEVRQTHGDIMLQLIEWARAPAQ